MAACSVTVLRAAGRLAAVVGVLLWGAVVLARVAGRGFVLSPMFAYVSRDDIYLADVAGRTANLTHSPTQEMQPGWSPDSRWLAFAAWDGVSAQLYMMSAFGDERRSLTQTNAANLSPAWTPDGGALVYLFERVTGTRSYDVFTLSLASGVVRNLTDDNLTNRQVVVSPRGDAVAYLYGDRRVRVGRLPYGDILLETPNGTSAPAWAPDGEQLAYVGPRGASPSSVIDTIFVQPTDLTAPPIPYPLGDLTAVQAPAWSPVGDAIAFLALPGVGQMLAAYLLELETGVVYHLTDTSSRPSSLAWSPDGARLMFARHDLPADLKRVCFYELATGGVRCPVSFFGQQLAAAWRPALPND